MVKECSVTNYPSENEEQYKEHFEKFNYPLHIFQKWAIEAIVEGQHVLACCPTGSGKSLPAEFALDYFHSIGKKTIYCSPIKSLSNQKFSDFSQKYPHISVGIITGDIRNNPDADVLVMTTEILLNKLYQIKSKDKIRSSVSFEMDIETELGCVIFDEIHYINDESRGSVWENSIMLLPRHIQMIGLSATLDDPVKFASWLENRDNASTDETKTVYLTTKKTRAVPLIHYSFITTTQGIFKSVKDKSIQAEINGIINKPHIIQDAVGKFNDENFFNMKKMLKLFDSNKVHAKRPHVLNQVSKYLTEHEMTPAICYIFSIKQIETSCREVSTNLLEFDSKVPYIAQRECEQILRSKLSNFEEYIHLPEYLNLVALLEKGIATHHSKMLPILREIVEIFFAKGYIKLLFATESVAIGLNLPVKTCIFTDVNKHDGICQRTLYSHEYTQSAGRAGRLGLDKIGHVIHLNNLFREVDSVSYKQMMNGKAQTLTSKFKISYNLVLNMIDIGNNDLHHFASGSMIKGNLDNQVDDLNNQIFKVSQELESIKQSVSNLRTPNDVLDQLIDLQLKLKTAVNKKRKETDRQLKQISDNYPFAEKDKLTYQKITIKETEISNLKIQIEDINRYIKTGIDNMVSLLTDEKCVEYGECELGDIPTYNLTTKGKISSQLRETHCLSVSKILEDNLLDNLSSKQLVAIFSIFTNIKVHEDAKDHFPNTDDTEVKKIVNLLTNLYEEYCDKETTYHINTGYDYTINYDLLTYLDAWCDCDNVEMCKIIIQRMVEEKEICLGEFVKAVLKISNIANEMEKIAEMTGNITFLSKLKEIPKMILKFVVTNQSLYI